MSSSSNSPNGLSRRSMLRALAAVPVLPTLLGTASAETQTSPASGSSGPGFSFAAYGERRPMMYLPVRNDGQPRPDHVVRRVVRTGAAREGGRRGGETRCQDDLRSGHQGTNQGHHALHEQDGSHDVVSRSGMGRRGFG